MAAVVSPINSNAADLDPIVSVAGTEYLKEGIVPRAAAGQDELVAAQRIATHVDDAAFTPATDGVVVLGGFVDETSPDSANEGDAAALRATATRKLITVSSADTATITSVASQDTNITILAANVARIGATIFNNDTGVLYLKFGATATATTSNTVKLAAGGYYEVPAPVYRGLIDGIWVTSGTGSANVTELT